jgi:hypothetical protein
MNTITPIRFIASKMKNYQHYNRQIATLDKKNLIGRIREHFCNFECRLN